MPACINAFLKSGSFLDVPLVQNEILDNYIADMAKYASNTDSVKIRACYNSIPAQLAKDNKKFQYKVVQKGGSAALFGASIEWLNLAGVVLKCQRINQAIEPIAVYTDLSAFKLYMGDVGLLTMKSPERGILSWELSQKTMWHSSLPPRAMIYTIGRVAVRQNWILYCKKAIKSSA